ncbi:MAG: YfhO family protein, partial [Bacilli bacterium]|nr:YfhO family protein [Bacilli bacterium]
EKTLLKDSKKIIKYTYKNIDDNMYFYTNNSCIDFIIVNDTVYYFTENIDYYKYADEEIKIFDYVSLKENHLINTRTDEEEYNIFVGYNNYQENAFYAYKIDDNKFIEAASLIEQNQVLLSEFNEDNITGFIHVDQDKTVYTSIPYDDGWKVIINGKKVETSNLGNALLSFNVSQGDNHIKLSYQSKGLITGAIITFFSIIICVALSSKKIKKS